MPPIKEGDRVRIATRDQTPEDLKSSSYFAFYGGLTGTVRKVYGKAEAAVEIEQESLPRDIRKRHEEIRDQMKTKWLDGLSEEGRSKLTERERDFLLRYIVLVGVGDLERLGGRAKPAQPVEEEPPHRMTSTDLAAKEEEEFARHGRKN